MTERPEDRPHERRRTGPLGDDPEEASGGASGEEPTRRVPLGEGEEERTSRVPHRDEEEARETRVIRTPGATEEREVPYPRGYFEAAEEREARLRDMYGGVDWLAGFLGFVFAAVCGAFFSLVGGLVLGPFGGVDLSGASQLGPAAITGLAILALLIFVTYLFGGYVAGRLARFDGGRNGALTVLFTAVVAVLLVVVGGFLPGAAGEAVRDLIQGTVMPALGGVAGAGAVGLAVLAGAVVVALLGGILGGRLGSRYHSQIDRTT
ncbi:hypothetical protein Rxyl_1126 [Rubrobacter xylanophilus DSM 9941]|uniref:Uncharacterized protein n=1 Tax=Rubrobacter xylanophilus (strain DSM 9941 / JCM 11954 / NBRC 16129 / PRD-1) TaxID=266117 RepID=Q1AWY6_RUBXD|nr:ABC transporter permease [Rubrobacter xylanophilus]ABG04092.1 hypothetical protein Rxyl_1126 [Rubrobacter xylanophilus DSM 9941]